MIYMYSISWTINFVRVGTLILISHDLSDVILEAGKLIRYRRRHVLVTNAMFVLFFTSWFATRLGYFPLVVLRSALFDAPDIIQPTYRWQNIFQTPYAPRVIIGMLVCLQTLHLFWTIIIVRIVSN